MQRQNESTYRLHNKNENMQRRPVMVFGLMSLWICEHHPHPESTLSQHGVGGRVTAEGSDLSDCQGMGRQVFPFPEQA